MNLGVDDLRGLVQLGGALVGLVDEDFRHPLDGNGEGDDGVVGRAGCILVCGTVVAAVRPAPRVSRRSRGAHEAGFVRPAGT